MDFFADPIGTIAQLLTDLLTSQLGLPLELVGFILNALGVAVLGTVALVLPLFTIWLERRLIAAMQDRTGPNRVGPQGLLQTIADALKLLTKEDVTPIGADKLVYNFAPILVVVSVITLWAVLPFAINVYGADLNVAVLYVVAVGSLGTLAIMLGGWASNNKYALLGAFRTVAQLVCYEVPMILSLLVPVLLANSMSMQRIVAGQEQVWFIFLAPLAAFIFFISSVAETGRAPFDLLEAESEIVAGFNIEYSGMKFGMFMVAEFLHAFTVGALTAALFLGGWQGPGAEQYPLLGVFYFVVKSFACYFIIILMRATFPRIRIDHMLDLNWKFLVPLSVISIIVTMVINRVFAVEAIGSTVNALALFISNIIVIWAALAYANNSARQIRRKEEAALKLNNPDILGHDEHGHEAHGHAAPAH
jgi:NADH-quinone oxidoreductase subunit H